MIAEGGDQTLARFQQRLGLAMEWARRARPSLIPREDSTAEAPTSATVEPQNESPQQRRLLPADSPLWQSIKTTKEGTEYRLPDKLAAIARWCDLKGEGIDAKADDALTGLLERIQK
jgi:hypothetical protein